MYQFERVFKAFWSQCCFWCCFRCCWERHYGGSVHHAARVHVGKGEDDQTDSQVSELEEEEDRWGAVDLDDDSYSGSGSGSEYDDDDGDRSGSGRFVLCLDVCISPFCIYFPVLCVEKRSECREVASGRTSGFPCSECGEVVLGSDCSSHFLFVDFPCTTLCSLHLSGSCLLYCFTIADDCSYYPARGCFPVPAVLLLRTTPRPPEGCPQSPCLISGACLFRTNFLPEDGSLHTVVLLYCFTTHAKSASATQQYTTPTVVASSNSVVPCCTPASDSRGSGSGSDCERYESPRARGKPRLPGAGAFPVSPPAAMPQMDLSQVVASAEGASAAALRKCDEYSGAETVAMARLRTMQAGRDAGSGPRPQSPHTVVARTIQVASNVSSPRTQSLSSPVMAV